MREIFRRADLEVITHPARGTSPKPPLLFVHGTGHGAWCWEENFLPYFARHGHSSYAVSLRGHGGSRKPKRFKLTCIADYVEDIRVVVESLPSHPVLIGHSLGGLVVMKYLERYDAPGAVLIAPSPTQGMLMPGLVVQLRNPLLMAKVSLRRDYAVLYEKSDDVKRFLFSPDANMEKISEYTSKIGPEAYLASLESIFNLPRPSRIKTKILVLMAERDAILSEASLRRTARALNAELQIVAKIAHDMMLEANWKDAADRMIDWLRRETNV